MRIKRDNRAGVQRARQLVASERVCHGGLSPSQTPTALTVGSQYLLMSP